MNEKNLNKEDKQESETTDININISLKAALLIIILLGLILTAMVAYASRTYKSKQNKIYTPVTNNNTVLNLPDDTNNPNDNTKLDTTIEKKGSDMSDLIPLKPIIYLYPEQEMKVSVELGKPENISHTYPKYTSGWNVMAKPNGDLVDLDTGRNLYSLYWEGKENNNFNMNDGFIVKGEDTIPFLEEKLEILGLTEREANEFIIYWLPKLESNKYNYIRFQTMEEINEIMPLNITPKPDTTIRVMMEFKAIDKATKIKEQILETPERNGFIAVEWGGIIL